jgi:hypothetical protein
MTMKRRRAYAYFGRENRFANWSVIWALFLVIGFSMVLVSLASISYDDTVPGSVLAVLGIGIGLMLLGGSIFRYWIKHIL